MGTLWIGLAVFVAALALHAGLAAASGWPVPKVHDEFAYLLMGDTFASGRLTNPPHPRWEHFETFHVLQHPTYQGKYPPGQGAFLAVGHWLAGHPAAGVYLSMALALAGTLWMLAGLVPRPWAVLGCALFGLHAPIVAAWGQSYWGGAVAMLGGALFFGALARLRRDASWHLAWVLATGLFVMANSRPQEGAVAALLALPLMLGVARRATREHPGTPVARRMAVALVAAALAVAAWTLYYDLRVTGNALQMPHFAWRPEDAVHPDVRAYPGSNERDLPGKLFHLLRVLVGTWLALALPFLARRLRSETVRAALWIVGGSLAVGVLASTAFPHYFAPIAGPIVYLVVEALRGLAGAQLRGRRAGRAAVAGLVAVHLALGLRFVVAYAGSEPSDEWRHRRQAILERLSDAPGRHLVLVRYPTDRDFHEEWVYNAADVDRAPVVWAHDLGPERNEALLEHFRDRRAWVVETEAGRLEPLPPAELIHAGGADGPARPPPGGGGRRSAAGRAREASAGPPLSRGWESEAGGTGRTRPPILAWLAGGRP